MCVSMIEDSSWKIARLTLLHVLAQIDLSGVERGSPNEFGGEISAHRSGAHSAIDEHLDCLGLKIAVCYGRKRVADRDSLVEALTSSGVQSSWRRKGRGLG